MSLIRSPVVTSRSLFQAVGYQVTCMHITVSLITFIELLSIHCKHNTHKSTAVGPFLLRWALNLFLAFQALEGGRQGVRFFFSCLYLFVPPSQSEGLEQAITSRFKTNLEFTLEGGLSWTERALILNQENRTSYYYYSQRRFQNDFFYIISYYCMYSLFIFHPLFNIICYCLSMRLVFIFHFQKETASLLLTCFLI